MEKVTIVSSAIAETFPADGKIILLGSWCLANPKIDINLLDYELLDFHWDKPDRFYGDIEYLEQVYEEYLGKVTIILNEIHGTNYSERYWRINLGWWLIFFIEVLFDRWKTAQIAAEKFPHGEVKRIIQNDHFQAESNSSAFFHKSANDEDWNERLTSDILENFTGLKVFFINKNLQTNQPRNKKNKYGQSLLTLNKLRVCCHKYILNAFYYVLKNLLLLVFKKTLRQVSLESTYLNRLNKFKLFYALRAIPNKFSSWEILDVSISENIRDWKFFEKPKSEFAKALEYFLPRHLPKCFLEGFIENRKQSDHMIKSSLPEVIVTANDFAANDSWKFWAAECVERGSKLVIAQHGGSYGSAKYLATQNHEISISDRFLSWGWENESESKISRAPAMKLLGMRTYKPKNKGFCLLVTASLPRRSYHLGSWPVGPQFENYFMDHFEFANNLSNDVRSNLAIRLFPQDFEWRQQEQWRNFDPEVNLLPLSKSLSSYLKETKLFISTYNATTFLESFKRDIPTVIYWDLNYWEINESSKPYFKLLQDAKIFFDNPKDAALHVNDIWDFVPTWWNSTEVKEAVKEFNNNFAYTGTKPFEELRLAILNWQ